MKTKKLQIRDVFCYMESGQQVKKAITNFAASTVIDLLETNAMNWQDEFSLTKNDFIESGKSELLETDCQFTLTNETSLFMRFVPKCEFRYNKVDESSVGLGGVGEISDVNARIEITGLYYVTADGSEIDLTRSEELIEYLHKNINIKNN